MTTMYNFSELLESSRKIQLVFGMSRQSVAFFPPSLSFYERALKECWKHKSGMSNIFSEAEMCNMIFFRAIKVQ